MLPKFSGVIGGTYCLKECGLSIYKWQAGGQRLNGLLIYKPMRERQNYELNRRFDDRRDRDPRWHRDSRESYGRTRSPPRDNYRPRDWRRDPATNGRRSHSTSESDKQRGADDQPPYNSRNATKQADASSIERSPELNRGRNDRRESSPRRDRRGSRSRSSSSRSRKSARSDSSSVSLPSHARSNNSSADSRSGNRRRKGDNKFYKKVNVQNDRYAVYRKSYKKVFHGEFIRR